MSNSKYLEKLLEEYNITRHVLAKRQLINLIFIAVAAIAIYIGLPHWDSRAASTATIFSGLLGFVCIILLVRFLLLSRSISNKILNKCEQEIQNNLNQNETFALFDADITQSAFGEYPINDSKVHVGKAFILFEHLTTKGIYFKILRVDNLGDFDVNYFTQDGGKDIDMDIKDKNGKFIRSIMTSHKDKFYNLLNAMEKAKSCVNNNYSAAAQSAADGDTAFVSEVKSGVKNRDKKNSIKYCIFGIIFGVFLCIASSSSGVVFAYGGLTLIAVSIISIIAINIMHKK